MVIAASFPESVTTAAKPVVSIIARIIFAIRTSIVNFIWALGILSLVSGFLLSEGVVAGLLGIFGVSALIYGAVAYLGLRAIGYPRINKHDID